MNKHFVIMAGGTGGHVIPALSVAKALMKKGHTVSWLGTEKGIEARLVPAAGIQLHCLNIAGVRGKGLFGLVKAPFKIIYAVSQALKILRREKPDCVLGLGGFASGPGGVAAKLLGIALVIHEQNAVPGTTNRILAKLATTVLQAFPDSFDDSVGAFTVGNPVRDNLRPAPKFKHETLNILLLGGSLGAKAINEALPLAINQMQQVAVWHQTGKGQEATVKAAYQNVDVKVEAFIDDMASAYAWADVLVCRAGAMTVSEVAAVGLPALFIPYPYAIDDHQTANAMSLVKRQAAFLLQQKDMTTQALLNYLQQWQNNPENRQLMADNAAKCAVFDATEQVISHCMEAIDG